MHRIRASCPILKKKTESRWDIMYINEKKGILSRWNRIKCTAYKVQTHPMAASNTAACWRACSTTIGPRERTRNRLDTAAPTSRDTQHTKSDGYRHRIWKVAIILVIWIDIMEELSQISINSHHRGNEHSQRVAIEAHHTHKLEGLVELLKYKPNNHRSKECKPIYQRRSRQYRLKVVFPVK